MSTDHRVASDQAYAATIQELHRCFRCNGTGNQMYFMYQRCEHCNGTGRRHSPCMWAGASHVQ